MGNNIIRKEIHYVNLMDSKDDDEGDGTDIEEIRYYGASSYDDNLDLIGYSADWRNRKTGRLVAVIDFDAKSSEGKVRLCPHCESFGFQNPLGVRIVKQGEKRPSDWDQWLQCHTCGNIYARFEIEIQKTLKTDTEKYEEENPFDAKQSIVIGIPSRTSKEGKRISARKKRERNRAHHSDPDIDLEIQQHGEENVRIISDSDP